MRSTLLTAALIFLPFPLLSETPRLHLSQAGDDAALAALAWAYAPSLADERGQMARARAATEQAALWANPELELGVGTLPIGDTEPPGLDRLTEVPNAFIELSYPFEVGKRAPRREAAQREEQAAEKEAQEALRALVAEAQELAAQVAAAQQRQELLERLLRDAVRGAQAEQERYEAGAATAVERDRAALEEGAWRARLMEAEDETASLLAGCAALVGVACEAFEDTAQAARFLAAPPTLPVPEAQTNARRPLLEALEEREKAALAKRRLARAKAFPDPTLSLGYLFDQFHISGNQRHSVGVSVSVPLPLLDAGRADALAAEAEGAEAALMRRRLSQSLDRQTLHLRERAAALERRLRFFEGEALPLARAVVSHQEAAAAEGALLWFELILSRRALAEQEEETLDAALALYQTRSRLRLLSGAGPVFPPDLSSPNEEENR